MINGIETGDYSYGVGNIQLLFAGNDKVRVGKFCSIAACCNIYLQADHRTDWITTYPFGRTEHEPFQSFDPIGHPKSNGDVIIGNDVWIAANVTIMSGVSIGDGAVIATNSHVVKDVEPYSIVGGNPAKFIKYRFPQEIRTRLLTLKWWDWSEDKIRENLHLLCSTRVEEFLLKNEY